MVKLVRADVICKFNKIHNNKYDYSKVDYVNNSTKVCIICPEHGEFFITAANHFKGYGCKICKGLVCDIRSFTIKCSKTHNNKYDYSKVDYVNNSTKVCIICSEHGEFWQSPNHHISGSACPKCALSNISQYKFIYDSNILHNNKYDYSKVEYINRSIKICIICPEHGEFWQVPNSHLNGHGCSKCFGNCKSDTISFIENSKEVHNNKYDYSKVDYVNNSTKVCIICPEHGEFYQQPNNHLSGKGCIDCFRADSRLSLSDFTNRSNIIHNNKYDYSKVDYTLDNIKICIICPEHGEFWQVPNSHLNGHGCSSCKSYVSSFELELLDCLNIYDVDINQSCRDLIHPFELDLVIPSKNIAIEFNGNYWHSELNGKDKNYHFNKTKLCNEKGIRLIHIFEDEWVNKQQIVKNRLKSILGSNKYRIYARKCIIKEIDNKSKSKFLNKYHIQGNDQSSIRLGCFYKNRLVAVMTFGKRRFDNKDGYELIRYCTIAGFTCVGCASKLLKYFERNWTPSAIISYADLRWSEGNVYKQLGFKHLHNSKPNYFYMSDYRIRESRIQYQKHKLKDKLDTFDPTLTEWENMKNNNFDRIWDCGNMVFEKCV